MSNLPNNITDPISLLASVITIYDKFKSKLHSTSYQSKPIESDENIHQLWDIIDSLSVDDKKLIYGFLKSKNTPIIMKENQNSKLLNSSWINKTEVENNSNEKSNSQETNIVNNLTNIDITKLYTVSKIFYYKYKLKDEVYELLKYSINTYGKISNFEDEGDILWK